MKKTLGRNYKSIKKVALMMYENGVGSKAIADALGVTMSTVCAWARNAGLPAHNPRAQEAMKRRWQTVREAKLADEPAEDLPIDVTENEDAAAAVLETVKEDDDWGREMLKTLRAIADALGVAV